MIQIDDEIGVVTDGEGAGRGGSAAGSALPSGEDHIGVGSDGQFDGSAGSQGDGAAGAVPGSAGNSVGRAHDRTGTGTGKRNC